MDEHGVPVDLAKIQVICNWSAPMTLIELHSFLVVVNIYCRFGLGFSHNAWPLNHVTKGGSRAKSQQKSFEDLKHAYI
jgi:hypothetical protein